MVSPGYLAVLTEKALAEDTCRRECPHDVVGLHVRKGTMWMSNDGVPLKNVESPYGGGVSPTPPSRRCQRNDDLLTTGRIQYPRPHVQTRSGALNHPRCLL